MGTTRREASYRVGQVKSRHQRYGSGSRAYHPGTRKNVPAETDTIALLNVAPLLLESLVIHLCHVDFASPTCRDRQSARLSQSWPVCSTDREIFMCSASRKELMLLPRNWWPEVDGAEELGVVCWC